MTKPGWALTYEATCRQAIEDITWYRSEVRRRLESGEYDPEPLHKVEDLCRECIAALVDGDVAMLLAWHAQLVKTLDWSRIPIIEARPLRAMRKSGGHARAARLAKDPDRHAWMVPLFDAAYASLDAECPARIGHEKLLLKALCKAGPTHEHRDELTEYRARLYLKKRRKPAP